jgi:hypothetical protein
MESFNDGDQIEGRYGNLWTRRGGRWYNGTCKQPSNDETMDWLLRLNDLEYPEIIEKGPDKISKTEKQTSPGFKYHFTLRRAT